MSNNKLLLYVIDNNGTHHTKLVLLLSLIPIVAALFCKKRLCFVVVSSVCLYVRFFCLPSLPPVFHYRIGPIGLQLSDIFFRRDFVVVVRDLPAVLVVVDALEAVALHDALPQQLDRLVRHLPLPRALFRRPEERDGILRPAALYGE